MILRGVRNFVRNLENELIIHRPFDFFARNKNRYRPKVFPYFHSAIFIPLLTYKEPEIAHKINVLRRKLSSFN